MIEAEVTWLDLDGDFAALEDELTRVIQGLTVVAWNSVLSKTPQFYGRAVASWNYSLNAPNYEDRSQAAWDRHIPETDKGPFSGLWRGHPVGIAIANANNIGMEINFHLGDTVYFSNGVDHGEGAYAGLLETDEIRLRSVNKPGKPVSRTLDWLGQKYADITAYQASNLKIKRIGGSNATQDS